VLSWLRRTLGWFERRWIHDPRERDRYDDRVRDRLADSPPRPVPSAPRVTLPPDVDPPD
jgi:hypothetical protein